MCLDLQQIKDYILYLVLPGSALPKVMEDIRLLSLYNNRRSEQGITKVSHTYLSTEKRSHVW